MTLTKYWAIELVPDDVAEVADSEGRVYSPIYLASDVDVVVGKLLKELAHWREQSTKTVEQVNEINRAVGVTSAIDVPQKFAQLQADLAHVTAELSAETNKRIELVGEVFSLEKANEGLKQRLSRYEVEP